MTGFSPNDEAEAPTEVLTRIHGHHVPIYRRITALALSGFTFVFTGAWVVWWVIGHSHNGDDSPGVERIGVCLLFLTATAAFVAALSRDYHNRRNQETEQKLRALLSFNHEETRRLIQEEIRAVVQRVVGEARSMHEVTRTEAAAQVGALGDQAAERHRLTLNAFLALETAIPELAKNAKWSARVEMLREAGGEWPAATGDDVQSSPSRNGRRAEHLRSVGS
jgi:hypothetical protein